MVKDESNKVIGSGYLQQGGLSLDFNSGDATCSFSFLIKELPKAEQYQVELGRRGSMTYSFADRVASNWTIGLKIGP